MFCCRRQKTGIDDSFQRQSDTQMPVVITCACWKTKRNVKMQNSTLKSFNSKKPVDTLITCAVVWDGLKPQSKQNARSVADEASISGHSVEH